MLNLPLYTRPIAAALAIPILIVAGTAFTERLEEYRKLRARAIAGLSKLKPTPSAEEIAQHQGALADRIRTARAHTGQGNIFTPDTALQFRKQIASAMQGQAGASIRRSLASSAPVRMPLAVNLEYPQGIPLQTTPPTLLANLPKLPAGFEYRVVDRNLVLLDVEANLIVDYLPDAIAP